MHRLFTVAVSDSAWRYWNTTSGFAQRFTGTFSPDGDVIAGHGELSRDDGATWDDAWRSPTAAAPEPTGPARSHSRPTCGYSVACATWTPAPPPAGANEQASPAAC